jgi:hypothetical protein
MRAGGLDARDGTLTPTKVPVEYLIPAFGGPVRVSKMGADGSPWDLICGEKG